VLRSALARTLPALAAAALAACSDSPTSPAATHAPQAAPRAAFTDAGVIPGVAEVRTLDGQLLGGATLAFWREMKDSSHVLDNSEQDLDKTDGKFRVMLPAGASYKVLNRIIPEPYAFAGTSGLMAGTMVNGEWQFPVTLVAEKPVIRVGLFGRRKQPALGATITVTAHTGYSYLQTVTDGGTGDLQLGGANGDIDGVITVRAARQGEWNVCETKAPFGYLLADPSCVKVTTKWGGTHKATLLHDTGIIAPPAPTPM
jgi:hypothetical protein